MTDLRKAAEDLLEGVEVAIKAGDWKVDGACDPDSAIIRLRQALAQPEQEPVGYINGMYGGYMVFTPINPSAVYLNGTALYTAPVDAVNMSQERVEETAKGEHEPWPSVRCVCGGTIYFKYTPPVSDYHEGWEEGFKAGKRDTESSIPEGRRPEWVGLTDEEIYDYADIFLYSHGSNYGVKLFGKALEATLKEKNGG